MHSAPEQGAPSRHLLRSFFNGAGPVVRLLPVVLVSCLAAFAVSSGGGDSNSRGPLLATQRSGSVNSSQLAELVERQKALALVISDLVNEHNGKPKQTPPGEALLWQFPYHMYKRHPCATNSFPHTPPNAWGEISTTYTFHGKAWKMGGGAILHGTAQAQRVIYSHQHPPNCTDVKFLVHTTHGSGIGSQVHMYGAALALAMALGRVYVEVWNDEVLYTRGKPCGSRQRFDECFFEPFSSCTPRDAGVTVNMSLDDTPEMSAFPVWQDETKYEAEQKDAKTIILPRQNWGGLGGMRTVPLRLVELLRSYDMITEGWWWRWWRAQAAAYVVRFNGRTKKYIRLTRAKIFANQTLEPGTIAVHVRRGDKISEDLPVPEDKYWEQVLRIKEADPRLRKSIFLITYEPKVLGWFQQRCKEEGWQLLYTDEPRLDDEYDTLPTSEIANRVGPTTHALNAFVGLVLAIRCEAWVGTHSSNWGRLIDELRATVGCSADKIYLDAAMGDTPWETDFMIP